MNSVIERVADERKRQDKKWGVQNHDPDRWIVILTEEVGESAKESYELNSLEGRREMSRSARLHRLETELIQTAAVAVAAVESIERNLE
jgi:hypothetical protein